MQERTELVSDPYVGGSRCLIVPQADKVWFVKWSCSHRGKRYSVVGLGLTREDADAIVKQKAAAFWKDRKARGDKLTAYSTGWAASAARL